MDVGYTNEENVRMLVSLLKSHGIKRVIASPGTTNITFVASLQYDSYFEVYSSVDERSAAYLACGMAAESGEPVVLSCTGATASRNYLSGLTEAYYRKLPVLAVTSMQHPGRVGQYVAQVIDRSDPLPDTCVKSVQVESIHCDEDAWSCNVKLNEALLALRRDGNGPVHINLQTTYSPKFTTDELPAYRVIRRYTAESEMPPINAKKIGVVIGAHVAFDDNLTSALDEFCAKYDAVVLCDQTSNYRGKYRVLAALVTNQDSALPDLTKFDLLVHIGQVSGAALHVYPTEVWRVNPDGEIRDCYKKQTKVFEMSELFFFSHYATGEGGHVSSNGALTDWADAYKNNLESVPELPFSNLWIAQQTAAKLPSGSILHLGILNSLRVWNMFETPADVKCYSNTGGFGIDGVLSAAIGASLVHPEKLYFCVLGDLAFFYDMNSLGNRHVGANLRILLVNNGRGTEFRNYSHPAAKFGAQADPYMAAAGHFGNKSGNLVKHYTTDLGFKYLTASNKNEYLELLPQFLAGEDTDNRPIVFEVFTDSQEESDALEMISNVAHDSKGMAKQLVRKALGQKGLDAAKKLIGR